MSKEEFLKIQTSVLKVSIHCDGCKKKVKKILQKIDGVYKITIESEQGKVTVCGNIGPDILIKKLNKKGKRAELWGAPKPNNNDQKPLDNPIKDVQLDMGNEAKKGSDGLGGEKGGNIPQPQTGGQQQIPQLQQMKGSEDMKMPPEMKMPIGGKGFELNLKALKLNGPEEGDLSGDDEDEFDEEDFDEDDMDDVKQPQPKPVMGNGQGGGQMPLNMMMKARMIPGQQLPPNMMKVAAVVPGGANAKKGGGPGGNIPDGGANTGNGEIKSGGGDNGANQNAEGGAIGNVPVQVNGGNANIINGGKKSGGGNPAANQNLGDGGKPVDGKNNGGEGGQNKDGGATGGGVNNIMPMRMSNGGAGQMGSGMPMGQMGPRPSVHGLPGAAAPIGNYFPGANSDAMPPNQMAAMMMNQQRANGNERFQQMMYARPPPAVNYMPPQSYQPPQTYQPPYPYQPYEQPHMEPFNNYFTEENPTTCSIM